MDKFNFACVSGNTSDAIAAELIDKLGPIGADVNLGFVYATDLSAPF